MRDYPGYMAFLKALNLPLGDHTAGEIEIVVDFNEIVRIENFVRIQNTLRRVEGHGHGFSDEAAEAGIIAQDQFFTDIRDAVIFPNGKPGLYRRVVYTNATRGTPGIAIFPITQDKRIVLSKSYRHANRHYALDVPGTIGQDGESHTQAIYRCLQRDFGHMRIHQIVKLSDNFVSERGLLTSYVPLYGIIVDPPVDLVDAEYGLVAGHVAFSKQELDKALLVGYVELDGIPYYLHDGYLVFGLKMAELHGLI